MPNWRKKMEAGGGDDLRPGEQLVAGAFLNPDGLTGSLMAKSAGGVIGGAIADRRRGAPGEPVGLAAVLPPTSCWIGVTPNRILVWNHGQLRGRPTSLHTELLVRDLVAVDAERRKTTHAVTLTFADGSERRYEAPRMGNDIETFAAAINDR